MRRYISYLVLLMVPLCLSAQDSYELLLKAKSLADRGRLPELISFLSGQPASATDFRLKLMLADAKMNSGNYLGAEADYRDAEKLMAGSGQYGLARISALKGDVRSSLYHLDKNIASQFRKSEKEIMLDPAFSVLENTSEWRAFWKTERYNANDMRVSDIEYNLSSGNKEDALRMVQDMKSMYPGDEKTLYVTALALEFQQKYQEAAAILIKLTETSFNETWLRALARVQTESANYPGASDTYSKLISANVVDPSLFIRRAECFRKTGETDKARTDIDKYLSLYPESQEALSFAGRLEAENGNSLKAMEYYSENLKLHPANPQNYVDRANIYYMSKSWENAISDYAMALDLKPDNPDAWLNKGISLLNKGNTEDACHDFRKALSLGNKKAASYISSNCIK